MLNVKFNLCLIKWFGGLLVCLVTVSTQNNLKLRKLKRVKPAITQPISLQLIEFVAYNPSESVSEFNLSLLCQAINHPSACEVEPFRKGSSWSSHWGKATY